MFLPKYTQQGCGTLIRALKKVYSQEEIKEYLNIAQSSIVYVVDTFQSSYYYIDNFGEENETTTEIKYKSGEAKMTLFGIQVVLPEPKLEDGETVTSEHFLKDFKESRFYFELTQNF